MIRTVVLLPALAGPALSQSTSVLKLYLPGLGHQQIEGSVIAASSSTTSYFFSCHTEATATCCFGLRSGLLYTAAPSSLEWHHTPSRDGLDVHDLVDDDPAFKLDIDFDLDFDFDIDFNLGFGRGRGKWSCSNFGQHGWWRREDNAASCSSSDGRP
ncbi:hypothetical protein B0T17DRAFT_618509 [Bombardia bombarda]|uniref:Uncharacterized protein n=1 Tax=Bombardia bombarda TaxID=252184 RepID=A0AA39WLX7_9PEZI|nr:hypothetical protein B0T17DRAFT_618509 [Bombardia bombarda]